MGSPTPALASSNIKTVMPVLPEARVLLKRLTDQELLDAGAEAIQPAIKPQINAKETNLKRGTIVLDETDKSKRKVTRIFLSISNSFLKIVKISTVGCSNVGAQERG